MEIKENKRFSLSYATSIKEGDSLAKLVTDNSPKRRDQYEISVASALNNTSAS